MTFAKAQGICQDVSKNPSDFNANIAAHVAMADYKYNGYSVLVFLNRYMRCSLTLLQGCFAQLPGLSAVDACCACGGGLQTSTPFTYSANLRSFVLGAAMKDTLVNAGVF